MKVDLKTTPNKVEKAVREIVNTAVPKEKLKEKIIPRRPLNSAWAAIEQRAEEMSPQEYISARQYLASLEHLYMLEK